MLVFFQETLLEGFYERSVMNNYFGIGIDAKISLDFHQKREEHPEKCRSRARNYMWYGVLGSREWLQRTYRCPHPLFNEFYYMNETRFVPVRLTKRPSHQTIYSFFSLLQAMLCRQFFLLIVFYFFSIFISLLVSSFKFRLQHLLFLVCSHLFKTDSYLYFYFINPCYCEQFLFFSTHKRNVIQRGNWKSM